MVTHHPCRCSSNNFNHVGAFRTWVVGEEREGLHPYSSGGSSSSSRWDIINHHHLSSFIASVRDHLHHLRNNMVSIRQTISIFKCSNSNSNSNILSTTPCNYPADLFLHFSLLQILHHPLLIEDFKVSDMHTCINIYKYFF